MDEKEIRECLEEGKRLETRLLYLRKKLKLLALASGITIDLDNWEVSK